MKPRGLDDKVEYNFFIIDGRTYDLRDWIGKHPGGGTWFARSNGRDISAAVHAYHGDPEVLKRILKKYEVDVPTQDARNPSLNVPPFIVPEGFNAHQHTPVYNWNNTSDFLATLRETLSTKEMRKRLVHADLMFDLTGVAILISHILLAFFGVYYEVLPAWILVVLLVITRTSLAAVGHYHCHRKKDGIADWGDCLFDMQYVGAHLVLHDGHVMLHHLYTNSHADPKRTVFTAMMHLPRMWRLPIYTIHRLGHLLTGMFIRWVSFSRESHLNKAKWGKIKHIQFLAIRLLLVTELVFFCYTGHFWLWIAQFTLCLWWNLFLIVSSHDFEGLESRSDLTPEQDWGIFQVKYSFDMSIVGNRYIDCFLTAGLGCHRVHHVLPSQRSGFANIISEPAVKNACAKFNVPWLPPMNFLLHRFPRLFKLYMFTPARFSDKQSTGFKGLLEETTAVEGYKRIAGFVFYGFRGIGSI